MDRVGAAPQLAGAKRGATLGVAIMVMTLAGGLAFESPAHAVALPPQIPGSPAAPTASEISPVCTTTTPSGVLGPSSNVPASPVSTLVTPAGGVSSFAATTSNLYVNTGTQLVTYTLGGTPVGGFALPANFVGGNEVSQPVVDPSGNIYLSSYYGTAIDKFSPAGTVLWSVDPQRGNPTAIFSVGEGAGWRLMASIVQDTVSSLALDSSTGSVSGTFPLVSGVGDYVTQEPGGNLLFSGNGYVETVNPSGQVLSTFGAPHIEGNGAHTGSGSQFYYPGQAVQGPDGTLYTADPLSSMEATSPNGFLKGSTTLGGGLAFGGWGFALVGSTFYFQSGPPFNGSADAISTFSLSAVQSYVTAVQRPSNSLGWGAGLTTPAQGNYFAYGTTPVVTASFDRWWTAVAPNLQLSYSVEDTTSLSAETVPTPTTINLPSSAASLGNIPLTLPAADAAPGPYQVQATLVNTATNPPTTLGTTCLPYTVGASGNGLDLSSLPPGSGSGGPTDPRGVALNAQLGLDSTRARQVVDWGSLLPNCSAATPTAATCGPTALALASATTDPYRAAFLAVQDHVNYWMQVSGGDAVSMALVQTGFWQGDVAALVAHYATVPSGCGACAPVTKWEPWNESNNTGWGNGATYATSVLKPFYAAVKSVQPGPSSTVIGGSSLEPVPWWWQQLITAGGLAWMDVAGIHPYTGSNNAYEEDGMPSQVRQLQALLGGKPLWFTEIGWWSDGDYNFLGQANSVARSMIWQKVLGVAAQNYFYDEGTWGNNGISFSLVQASSTVDYVKPAALATMATSGILAGRPYLSMPATGIPQGYRADFGTTNGGTTKVAAVWTDGLAAQSAVTLTSPTGMTEPVTITSQYGSATTTQVTSGTTYRLPMSDQVNFITYRAADNLTVSPTEAFGTDVASSAAHATASASSGNAGAAIAGLTVGYGMGWTSAIGDTTPSLTVTLASPSTLDRVIVNTQSVGSTATSVRNYTLSANEPGSGWVPIKTMTGQFRNHEALFDFPPLVATQLQVVVTEVNFGGYYGGGVPPWWGPSDPAPAFLHAVEAFAGSGGPAVVDGGSLPALLGGGTGGGTTTTTTTSPSTTTTVPSSTTTLPITTTTTLPTTTTTTTIPTTTTTVPSPTTTTTPSPTNGGDGANGANQTWRNKFKGYWLTTADGGIFTFGSAPALGSTVGFSLNKPIVDMTSTPDKKGYWMVSSDGGIFNFGDAGFYGSTGGMSLNRPIVGMASTADGLGYWLVASDGGIFAFGDAAFAGSTGAVNLNKPIVHMSATPDGGGYWLTASDGGIFAFGDAQFFGSTGAISLNMPIVGMDATPDGQGYWLAASDGGIFAFGDAGFYGSTGGRHINAPVTGIQSSATGNGYWMVGRDGGIFAFGDAHYLGSAGNLDLQSPTVSIS
jgi:hypothetical protein